MTPGNVANLFLASFVPALATAMNATQRPGNDTITDRDVHEFILCFCLLSFYRASPTLMWENLSAFPLAKDRSKSTFTKCLNALKRLPYNERADGIWRAPFEDDIAIAEVEKGNANVNRQLCFVKDITRLSIDDDQLRLTSKGVENIGLVRICIPNKGFGPVCNYMFR